MEQGGDFLKTKYSSGKDPLHTSTPVERAARRKAELTGDPVAQKPAEKIDAYLDRLERLILDPEAKELGARDYIVKTDLTPSQVVEKLEPFLK